MLSRKNDENFDSGLPENTTQSPGDAFADQMLEKWIEELPKGQKRKAPEETDLQTPEKFQKIFSANTSTFFSAVPTTPVLDWPPNLGFSPITQQTIAVEPAKNELPTLLWRPSEEDIKNLQGDTFIVKGCNSDFLEFLSMQNSRLRRKLGIRDIKEFFMSVFQISLDKETYLSFLEMEKSDPKNLPVLPWPLSKENLNKLPEVRGSVYFKVAKQAIESLIKNTSLRKKMGIVTTDKIEEVYVIHLKKDQYLSFLQKQEQEKINSVATSPTNTSLHHNRKLYWQQRFTETPVNTSLFYQPSLSLFPPNDVNIVGFTPAETMSLAPLEEEPLPPNFKELSEEDVARIQKLYDIGNHKNNSLN